MTRQPRLSSQSGIYHVMLRGVNRQQIFEDDDDYRKFIMILHDMTSPKDELKRPLPPRCAFYAYCLMPNHVHLLIQEKEEKLSKTVKQIASRYAMYYNNKYEHFGHLFQDRFKSEPVESYSYFLTLIRYIHQNPVAGRLCQRVEDYDYERLAEQIIIRAAKDYRNALKRLYKYPENPTALATKEEIEMFFYSQWFTVLTKVNPNVIIKGIQEEIGQ